MIPRLNAERKLKPIYKLFLRELPTSGFEGDIVSDYGGRLAASTDNSVYQITPQAVLYPRNKKDVKLVVLLLNKEKFKKIKISPRGGGTGTNGQSLSYGIIIDFSRHMTNALEINHEEGWARVEPGMVLDRLNRLLKPRGLVFAPSLSPANRATIGGMINTDASGKGSLLYGRTSEHILELDSFLSDGTELKSKELAKEELENIKKRNDIVGEVYRRVDDIVVSQKESIQNLPKLERYLTGYNLEKIYSQDRRRFNLNYLLSGSEGTLCVVVEAKLKLTPIVKYKKLLLIKYSGFLDALKDARNLINTGPAAIETIDEKILELAKKDIIYFKIKHMLDGPQMGDGMGVNFVEYVSDNLERLNEKVDKVVRKLRAEIHSSSYPASGYCLAEDEREAAALWEMRKKGVGLLANMKGERKPIPFVEDTAVPPDKLADYIREFRNLLDGYGLEYGMFGHVDAGCLHVRPALDMKDEKDESLVLLISDQVADLVHKYGGVMWGEHGKGFRGQYAPKFFGSDLYYELRRVKAAFDPYNRFNPGKIVVPAGSHDKLAGLLDSPTRGRQDRQISLPLRRLMPGAMKCDGNAACFDYNYDSVMCPSNKASGDRVHSPKGRAALIREWSRLLSRKKRGRFSASSSRIMEAKKGFFDPPLKILNAFLRKMGAYDFSHEVFEAMKGCLSCKACAAECPLKVDVADFKSMFLHLYHRRYPRPPRDRLLAGIENSIKIFSAAPGLYNRIMEFKFTRMSLKNVFGLIDIPRLSPRSLDQQPRKRGVPAWDPKKLKTLGEKDKERSVILIQDAFTSFFESETTIKIHDFLTALGVRVYTAPFFSAGKILHIKGFLDDFRKLAEKNSAYLEEISQYGVPLAGIEPAVVLTYRDEYPKILKRKLGFKVCLIQEWMSERLDKLAITKKSGDASGDDYVLFGHCSEKTGFPPSQRQWQEIFKAFGYKLSLESVGCCGMAGVYGHEAENLSKSREIYSMSWGRKIASRGENKDKILASGYSCRCQTKRFEGFKPRHPLEALADITGCGQEARPEEWPRF